MGIKYFGLLLVFLLPALISGVSAAIYVENASVLNLKLNTSPVGLNISLNSVHPRIFTEDVDSLLGQTLKTTPLTLNSSLNVVRPRIFIEQLDATLRNKLIITPSDLNSSLMQVRPRIFTENLDSSLKYYLSDTFGLPKTGDINGNGQVTLVDAIYLAKHVGGFSGYETIYADGDINANGQVTLVDAIYLAKHVGGFIGYEKIY